MYNCSHDFSKGFPISNCVLYYLGWFYKSENTWEDLKKCLTQDGYMGDIFDVYDVARLIIGMADDWNLYAANNGYRLIRISEVMDVKLHLVEWFTKKNMTEPELLAKVWDILGMFALNYNRAELSLKMPVFSKSQPMKYFKYKNGATYKEANITAKKMWNNG